MKRSMGIMLVLLMLLTFICGCNSANVNSEINSEDKIVTSTTTTVSGGGTSGKTENGKETVSKVTPITDTSTDSGEILSKYDIIGNLDLETVKNMKSAYLDMQLKNENYENKKKIEEMKITDIYIISYGKFSDGSVAAIFVHTNKKIGANKISKVEIGKYTYAYLSTINHSDIYFTFPSEYQICFYKDNRINTFYGAYKTGMISEKIVDEFFEKYPYLNYNSNANSYKSNKNYDYTIRLNSEEIKQIKTDYIKNLKTKNAEIYKDIAIDDVIIYDMEKLSDGSRLLKIYLRDVFINPELKEQSFSENGNKIYQYRYMTGDEIIIYKNNNFYTVEESYKNQIVSKSAFNEIVNNPYYSVLVAFTASY